MIQLPAYIWGFKPPKDGSGGHQNACLCSLPASDEHPDLLLVAAFVIARLVNERLLCPVYLNRGQYKQ
ncbi:hypothetical protein Peur_063960 [Populus x canadensis]